MPLLAALALTAISGTLYGLAFPTASWHLVAWVVLVPFFLALRRATLGRALILGWLWTMTAAYAVGNWFPHSVANYYEQPLLVGIGFFVFVASFMAAPAFMAFAAVYRLLVRRPGRLLPFAVAATWVAVELARARLVGNPWALFGYSQMGRERLMQIADATSVYGVSFLLVAVNAALAELVAAVSTRSPRDRAVAPSSRRAVSQPLAGVALAFALVVAALAYGQYRLVTTEITPASVRPIRVAMVQANLDVGTQWREEFYGRNVDEYLRLTHAALRDSRAEIVFWPENALTFFLEDEPLYRTAIARVLEPAGAQLVTGGPRVEHGAAPVYYNSVFLLADDGSIVASYDKQRLVPFAEYFPVHALDFLRREFAHARELTPGSERPPLPTSAGPAGVTICNEAMFPEIAAARVRAGAVFFVDPAHDTWLTPKFSAQQFDIVRLRTVEERRYLVRASTSGPSAIVDPLGRVVAHTDFFVRDTLGGTIWPSTVVTPYARIGDAFAYACVLASVASTIVRLR